MRATQTEQNKIQTGSASIRVMTLLTAALICLISACAQKTAVQNSNSKTVAANEPTVNWAEGNLIIGDQTFKLNHAYAAIEKDPFEDNKYTIRVLLSEQPIGQDILDDNTALMNMKKDAKNHAMEIDIDEQRKVTWIGLWGLGQVSGLEYPFEPVVFNERMVEGRLFSAENGTDFDKKWKYDAKFKTSVRVDPVKSFVTASTGQPLAPDGGEPAKLYLDYQAALRSAKSSGDLDKFYSQPVLKVRNADPELKELALEMEKGSLVEDLKIAGGFIEGDKATLSIEGKSEGENLKGRVNLHREDGQWKLGVQSFKGGN